MGLGHLTLHRATPGGSWTTIDWVRATSARRSSRLPESAPFARACTSTLPSAVASTGPASTGSPSRSASRPAQEGVLGSAADDVHAAYVAAGQGGGSFDRGGEARREAGHDAAHQRHPAIRQSYVVLAAPVGDPGRHVARRDEPCVLHVEHHLRSHVGRRQVEQPRQVIGTPRPQGFRQKPGAHHVGEEPDPAVDAALVGEVGGAGLVGDHRTVELDADQPPRAAGDVRRVGVGHRDADHRRRGVVRTDRDHRRARRDRRPRCPGPPARPSCAGLDADQGEQLGVPLAGVDVQQPGRGGVGALADGPAGQPVRHQVRDEQQLLRLGQLPLGGQLVDGVERQELQPGAAVELLRTASASCTVSTPAVVRAVAVAPRQVEQLAAAQEAVVDRP